MLSPKIEAALNAQTNMEFQAAYLYLGMSLDMRRAGFTGAAAWLHAQYREEVSHAHKIIGHVQDRLGNVQLLPLDAPSVTYEQPIEVFRATLEHEKKVTSAINDLVRLAQDEGDSAAENLLSWFVDEQVEEEATAAAVVARFEMAGSNSAALLMVDSELSSRTES